MVCTFIVYTETSLIQLSVMVYFSVNMSWPHTLLFPPGNSLHNMYKLFLSAVEYLPFSSLDASKASCEEIIERFGDFRRQLAIECINFQIFRLYSWIYCKCVHLMQGSVKITTNQTQEVR
jgi:hypothetical protein